MTHEHTTSCLPCGLHQPRRNTYFDGKLLLERDFVEEQDYHRGHRHLHNALLHGAGTVCGLKIVQHPSPGCRQDFVVVEPGMALDCCGQEIVVPSRTLVEVRKMLNEDPDLAESLDGTRHLVVGIRRRDHGAEPVPAILPGCEGADGPTEHGRIAEGFEIVLAARKPTELTPVATPVRPRLTWTHTITLGGQVPRGVHLNEAEHWVQVAADARAGGSHIHVQDDRTHDLLRLLEGPAHVTETSSMREQRLVLVAGQGFAADEEPAGGVGFWRAGDLLTTPDRAGLLPVEGVGARIAVSPVSGTLFVLDLLGDERAALTSYSAEALRTWLDPDNTDPRPPEPSRRMEFGHGFGGAEDPALRGAAMMKFSHDGRFLAIAAPGADASERVFLIDVSAFHSGNLTAEKALAQGIDQGTEAVALTWSLDDAFLYLLSRRPGDTEQTALARYAITGHKNQVERQGRGVLLNGSARDLAVAPTETRAYVLLDDAGVARFTTVDMERVKAVDAAEPEALELSADTIRIDGAGRSLTMSGNGGRLYVAAADNDPQTPPDRGLVAVIEVQEDDCSVHFDRQIDGCPTCSDSTGCEDRVVVLGHVPCYPANGKAAPKMVDPEEAGESDAAIDNLTHRVVVPSAQSLRDAIYCMLARGIDEGPPGPRGDPGTNGTDGLSVTEVEVQMGEPGSAPVAEVEPNDDGLTLQLELPTAPPGATGAGIDDARIEYDDGLEEPVVSIVVEDGRRVLDIDLPAPPTVPGAVEVDPIIALSWPHGGTHPLWRGMASFREQLLRHGLAVAFRTPVAWKQFTGAAGPGPTPVVELQHRFPVSPQFLVWVTFARAEARPIVFDPEDITESGLLRSWRGGEAEEESAGFVLRIPESEPDKEREVPVLTPGEPLRLVLYADFLVDAEERPVSGAHIGAALPTGRGGPGGTFRSWFTIPDDAQKPDRPREPEIPEKPGIPQKPDRPREPGIPQKPEIPQIPRPPREPGRPLPQRPQS